jgi:FKBP-type peptidyl-prolyl cis-trans isomerase
MKKITVALLLCIVTFFSCKKGKEMKTDSGFKYILFTESKGPKVQIGDYVTMIMVYKNSKDSILFDSRKNGMPIRFKLEKIPFPGSYEEGLTYLSENDSARFFVPADSLYNYLYKSRSANTIAQENTGFTKGTFLQFDIKVLKLQTDVQAEEEMLMLIREKEKQERVAIMNYVNLKKIDVAPDSSGYYLFIQKMGKGNSVDSGRVVTIEYEGRFLNDSVFDGTKMSGRPYRFISGAHQVIRGWEMAMKTLHGGDKFTLVLPSRLAYGEEGIKDTQTGNYIVPPLTPLVFDIEILSVEDMLPVSRK